MKKYDYLIVGAGLAGCVFARMAKDNGKKVVIIEKKEKIGGMCSTKKIKDIMVHEYGAHIFKTNNKDVWEFVNKYDEFEFFINTPKAIYNNEMYSLPINMNTFHELWGCIYPEQAKEIIEKQKTKVENANNLEDYVLNIVGRDIYEKIIKEYTEKQWGKSCKELKPDVMRRIPIRFTYNNNYYNEKYQGIPKHGYSYMLKKMTEDIEIRYGIDYLKNKENLKNIAKKVVYSGAIDELGQYRYGELEYRGLNFKHKYYPNTNNLQGVAVWNHTDRNKPYTRTIEHNNFIRNKNAKGTIITVETPMKYKKGDERYYPINDERNDKLYNKYKELLKDKYILIGRLGCYKYTDMAETIENTRKIFKEVEYGK